ncbi:MAG: DUF1854 domain-containing protein [Kiritimatiellia bacterium]
MTQKESPADELALIDGTKVRFEKTGEGDIVLRRDGESVTVADMAPAFPVTHHYRWIVLRDGEGNEIGVLDNVGKLPAPSRRIVGSETEKHYFMPKITDIGSISEELGVVNVEAQTNRGQRTFQIRNVRQNVRKVGGARLIIRDVDGNRYEIPDWTSLPGSVTARLREYL